MRRFAIVVGVAVLLPVLLFAGGNTGPGRRAIEFLVAWASGGSLRIAGLNGRFPDALSAERLELSDPRGPYAIVWDAALDWSPMRLARGELAIDRLTAGTIWVGRLPEQASSDRSSALPVRVTLHTLRVGRLELAAPVAGADTVLALDGSGEIGSMTAGRLHLTARAPDDGASYTMDGSVDAAGMRIEAALSEPANGLLSRLAGLPDLGAVALTASLEGPRSALAAHLTVTAGLLHAAATGQIDLATQTADMAIEAAAPAMRPGPDLGWQSIVLNGRVQGPLAAPTATGQLRIARLAAGGFAIDAIAADLSGDAGSANLHASLTGTRMPDPGGALFAARPVVFDATVRLNAPAWPVQFALRHPLLTMEGTGAIAGQMRGQVALTVPEVAPFAKALGSAVHGRFGMTLVGAQVGEATQVTADGTLITIGAPIPLLGESAKFHAAGTLRGRTVALTDGRIDGSHVATTFDGTLAPGTTNLRGTVEIDDLTSLRPDLAGRLRIVASVDGPPDDLAIGADLTGSVTTAGVQSGPLAAHIDLKGLPAAPQGVVTARGALLGAPLTLAMTARRQDDTIRAVVEHADWKSAHGEGEIAFDPSGPHREGSFRLSIGQLSDFSPLLGRSMAGDATLALSTMGQQVRLGATVRDGSVVGSGSIARTTLDATLDHLDDWPTIEATLTLDGVRAGGFAGSATVHATGPQEAMALTVAGSMPDLAGAPLKLSVGGTLDGVSRRLTVRSGEASWRRKTVRLLAPTRIDYGNGIAVDRVRLGLDKAELALTGPVSPTLGLTATLRDLPASLLDMVAPDLGAVGTIGAEAHLTGNPARPDGMVKIAATGLRLRRNLGRLLPVARIDADATLAGGTMKLDIRAVAGKSRLRATGSAPLAANRPLDLRAVGSLDIGSIDPLLAANGRHIAGTLALNTGIAGTIAAPKLSGGADLSDGEIRDDTLGMRLHAIKARLALADGTLRVVDATGRAGPGTVRIDGTIGILGPGIPIDLTLTARDARPLASDALTATVDADLTLRGPAAAPAVGGTVRAKQVDFRIPETLPARIATIAVHDPDRPPPVPQQPAPAMALHVDLEAPNRVFVRGRGIDAELGGAVQLRGTLDRPRALGGLSLRAGKIDFAGRTLNFSRGTIDLDGASLVDPTVHLVSTTSSSSVQVTLTVGGTAHAPKIVLTSVPDLPQDEILAQLLFNRGVGSLSPVELVQIASALVSLTGVGPDLSNPLTRVRQALGLDRLSVGTNATGGATLEAGRFVAPGVYVGTEQGVSGGGQATIRIDIAKGLTLQGSTSTGGSATGVGGESNGSSVGVGYQFEY